MTKLALILALFFNVSVLASDAKVFFESPKNGATVSKKFKVKFGLKGMLVHPAGELKEGTGHHHLIINGGPIDKDQVIPTDEKHIHFGKAQTETEVELAPGKYTLTLQFADGAHRSYGKDLSASISVTVK
jgi:hypothetical protein